MRVVLFMLIVVLSLGVGAVLASNDVALARAAVMLGVLEILSLLVFSVVARSDPEGRTLFALLLLSFGLKLVAIAFRYSVGFFVDAYIYHLDGEALANELESAGWPDGLEYTGTAFIRLITALVYFTTGVSFYGISILWAWFGLLGMLFFYKAFCTAFPSGDRRLYMLLIFLSPSMLLWTSSLGKDALMVMFLGMAAFGAARIQQRTEFVGLWWLALGMGGMLAIRPHMAAAFVIALATSILIRPIRAGMVAPLVRVAQLAVFIAVAVITIQTAAGAVRLESVSEESVLGFIDTQRERSMRGGSAFEQVRLESPAMFIVNVPTILFRPFIWEAHSALALVAALEGLGLLMLIVFRWRTVLTGFVRSMQHSYLLLILTYALLFIFTFSGMANFGIIARQRVQLFPFVYMLICFLAPARRDGGLGAQQVASAKSSAIPRRTR